VRGSKFGPAYYNAVEGHTIGLSSPLSTGEITLEMGRLRSSLWALVLVAVARVDGAIVGQLPLSEKDVVRSMDAPHVYDAPDGAVNGELRRYPYALTLLEEFQVRILQSLPFLRIEDAPVVIYKSVAEIV
jgi:hypothetical protein